MHQKYSLLKNLILLAGVFAASALVAGSALYLYLNPKLPSVEVLRDAKLQIPLRIYSQNGELIGKFGEKFRTPINMEDVPQHFINAILSAEDDRFLQHKGVDLAGLIRAAGELISTGHIRSGGSTITMQVARNFFLSNEQTFVRKFNEIFLALKIERTLSKNEILSLYLNKIYLGKRAYGIQAAAAIYYGKKIADLSLAQFAMIAGLPKAPSAYNPINNPARALQRRNWILGRMKKLGYIDNATWTIAATEAVVASYHGPKLQLDAGYAAEMARKFTIEKLGLAAYTDGYKVITTIKGSLQSKAKHAIQNGLDAYTKRHGYTGAEKQFAEVSEAQTLSALRKLDTINQHTAALISGFSQHKTIPDTAVIELLLKDGTHTALIWDQQHQKTRKFITQDRRSTAIKDPNEIFSIGDIIRIHIDEQNRATLSQIPKASASLIALNPMDGAINALVGGYDFRLSKFNRATQAYRQPGSNFKPFIYAAALTNGYTAAHSINDAPIIFSDSKLETDWRPENSSGKFYGQTTLRRALYLSRNIVSVRLLREMGIANAISYLNRFELSGGKLPNDLSLALGSYAMTPIEVARLYATLANGGYQIKPYLVTEIRDRHDKLVYLADPVLACDDCPQRYKNNDSAHHDELSFEEAESLDDLFNTSPSNTKYPIEPPQITNNSRSYPSAKRVIEQRVAYIIDNILQDVITRGTGTAARALKRRDLAGKTGTTNGPTDAWFSGYHPNLVATTWLGHDNNQLLGKNEYGGSAALPIWMDFMRFALQNLPTAKRKQPSGLKSIKIDRFTGLPPTASSSQTLFELFREENAPTYTTNDTIKTQQDATQLLDEELF